ncbi:MAG: hypothetical protein WA803_00505 [Steroidobacteraceae bacterium]
MISVNEHLADMFGRTDDFGFSGAKQTSPFHNIRSAHVMSGVEVRTGVIGVQLQIGFLTRLGYRIASA